MEDITSDFLRRVRKAVEKSDSATPCPSVRLEKRTPAGRLSIKFLPSLSLSLSLSLALKFVNAFGLVEIGLKISLDEALHRVLQYLIIGRT